MALLREPRAPRADVRYLFGSYLADERNDAWRTFLFLEPARVTRMTSPESEARPV